MKWRWHAEDFENLVYFCSVCSCVRARVEFLTRLFSPTLLVHNSLSSILLLTFHLTIRSILAFYRRNSFYIKIISRRLQRTKCLFTVSEKVRYLRKLILSRKYYNARLNYTLVYNHISSSCKIILKFRCQLHSNIFCALICSLLLTAWCLNSFCNYE